MVVGFASGTIPSPALNHALVKNYSILGLHWGLYNTKDPAAGPALPRAAHRARRPGRDQAAGQRARAADGAADAVQRVADGVTTGRVAVLPALENGAAA